ncbi:VapE domain-containing protein [Leptospirillum ferriphilum]|uniref:VapE domain-containing protein n=1 Tax=Leptospirillum ferriphilum TaxID=178606 RepID=UPI003EE775BF
MKNGKAAPPDGPENAQENSTTSFLDPEVRPDGRRLQGAESVDFAAILGSLPKGVLSGPHREMLKSSAIADHIVESRGYRTLQDTKANRTLLASLGFSASQIRLPGLLISLFNPTGEVGGCQLRPDAPRTRDGKPVKYETPHHGRPVLDVHPEMQSRLVDPSEPLWITEGTKKGDALASLGKVAISLSGVWGWIGSNGKGGTTALPEWRDLPLKKRPVRVLFDSDAASNPKVQQAEQALAEYLGGRGAQVTILRIPAGPEGKKQGVDDFLAGGGTIDDLKAIPQDPEPDWKESLVYSGQGVLRPTSWNVRRILENDPEFGPIARCRFNELTKQLDLPDGRVIDTPVITEACSLIEGRYKTPAIPFDTISRVVEWIAVQNPHNAIVKWLESLPGWDGKSRIDGLFPDYFKSKNTEYTRSVGKNLLIASCARAITPGCKFDNLVVLEGVQGIGKSSSIRVLFGGPEGKWTTEARSEIGSKDFIAEALGNWAVEISELASFRKSLVEVVKRVLATSEDNIRLSYRRDSKKYPRNFILIGTTNETHYLQDPTGSRRFWPIRCGRIDLEGLARDRDQLFAEALHRFRAGESWWIVPGAEMEAEERFDADTWESLIRPWLLDRWECTTAEILLDCLGIEPSRQDRACQIRVGAIMKRLGWERRRIRTGGGLDWVYVPISGLGTDGNNMGTSRTGANVPIVPIKNNKVCKEEDKAISVRPSYTAIEKNDDFNGNMGTSRTGANAKMFPCVPISNMGTNDHPSPDDDIPFFDEDL